MSKLNRRVRAFTQVPNDIVNDANLSLKAKGLFLFLLSKPDGWEFSARLIAIQNKDAISAVNSGLQELEDFGLLERIHVQGGYDYDIFDTVQVHLVENRLNGKSTKQKAKIHSMENPLNISNKEFGVILEKREKENIISDDLKSRAKNALDRLEQKILFVESVEIVPEIVSEEIDTFFIMPRCVEKEINNLGAVVCPDFVNRFLDFVSSKAKNPIAYRSRLRQAIFNQFDKNHTKTVLAYVDYQNNRPDLSQHGALPVGVNIFDLIGRD